MCWLSEGWPYSTVAMREASTANYNAAKLADTLWPLSWEQSETTTPREWQEKFAVTWQLSYNQKTQRKISMLKLVNAADYTETRQGRSKSSTVLSILTDARAMTPKTSTMAEIVSTKNSKGKVIDSIQPSHVAALRKELAVGFSFRFALDHDGNKVLLVTRTLSDDEILKVVTQRSNEEMARIAAKSTAKSK